MCILNEKALDDYKIESKGEFGALMERRAEGERAWTAAE